MVVTPQVRQKDRWDFRFPEQRSTAHGKLSSHPVPEALIADTLRVHSLNKGLFNGKLARAQKDVEVFVRRFGDAPPMPQDADLEKMGAWASREDERHQAIGGYYDQLAAHVEEKDKGLAAALTSRADGYHFQSMKFDVHASICKDGLRSLSRRSGMSLDRADRLVSHLKLDEALSLWYDKNLEKSDISKSDIPSEAFWRGASQDSEGFDKMLSDTRNQAVSCLSSQGYPAAKVAAMRLHVKELHANGRGCSQKGIAFDKACHEAGLGASHPVMKSLFTAREHMPVERVKDNMERE